MADNVAITAGAGTLVGTDELTIGGIAAHVQRMKNSLGRDGVFTADLAGRDLGSGDGAAYVDNRASVTRIQVTPTVSTTPAYTAKDAVGALLTFANAVRVSGGSGVLETVTLEDKGQQMKDLSLVLFRASITAPTDNAVFAPTDTELLDCIGVIPLYVAEYDDFSTNSVLTKVAVGLEFSLAATSLYGVLVARGTPTYTSTSDLVLTLTIAQD